MLDNQFVRDKRLATFPFGISDLKSVEQERAKILLASKGAKQVFHITKLFGPILVIFFIEQSW